MSMNRLPASWRVVAPFVHPVSGTPGCVIEMTPGTIAFWNLDGTISSIPWNWQAHPADACGLAAARALADHLRASQARDDEAVDA
jgi:hypothetical protein